MPNWIESGFLKSSILYILPKYTFQARSISLQAAVEHTGKWWLVPHCAALLMHRFSLRDIPFEVIYRIKIKIPKLQNLPNYSFSQKNHKDPHLLFVVGPADVGLEGWKMEWDVFLLVRKGTDWTRNQFGGCTKWHQQEEEGRVLSVYVSSSVVSDSLWPHGL